MSNSTKMSLEEILVQDLKENRLGALVGDEEALAKLAKRAIDEALFQDRIVIEGSGYNERKTREPSPVMQAAKEVAERAITKVMDDIVKELLEKPETKAALHLAVAELFPAIILRRMDHDARNLFAAIQSDTISRISQAFSNAGKFSEAQAVQQAHQIGQ